MLLAIDAGNTSITAGCLEDGELLCKGEYRPAWLEELRAYLQA